MLRESNFRDKLAKALSAFANSGGGQILLGVNNDGSFDGVEPLQGRTPTREWLEQIIPNLLEQELAKFRVHEVLPSQESEIPSGRLLIVIDVEDSPHAPHQTRDSKIYYYRSGGHSLPAPHFYLEALRNRLIKPILVPSVIKIEAICAFEHQYGIFVQLFAKLRIKNVGKVAAYRWFVDLMCKNDVLVSSKDFLLCDFPSGGLRYKDKNIPVDQVILPSLSCDTFRIFGINIRSNSKEESSLNIAIDKFFSSDVCLEYSVVSENIRGENYRLDESLLREKITVSCIKWLTADDSDPYNLYAGYGVICTEFKIEPLVNKDMMDLIQFWGAVENSSDINYLDLHLWILFKNKNGQTLHVEDINLERLPSKETKIFTGSVYMKNIVNYHKISILASFDLDHWITQD